MGVSQYILYVSNSESSWQMAFEKLNQSSEFSSFQVLAMMNGKKALKHLRRNEGTAVIIFSVSEDSLEDLERLTRTVRETMHNQTVRIIVCAEDNRVAASYLVNELGVNAVLHPGIDSEDRLKGQLSAEMQTFSLITGTQFRHQAETALLSAIARFSRLEMKLSECLAELASATGQLTNAVMVSVVVVRRNGSLRRSSVSYQAEGIDATAWLDNNLVPDSPQLHQVVKEARLQLQIQPDDPVHIAAGEALGCEVSGRFIYPLRSFGRTMCLVECWLPADGLDAVSVDLVRLIEKSSEQFGLLFERKQADSQLKRQYKRLKFTLDELSTTKNALYHSEKLASLGQLAAGIAHEINNPVAYVMGNFKPLNEYVDDMTRMLDLHGKFVSLIDEADLSVGVDLRQQIDEVGADLDIDYVMEDVRALVSESKEGLTRVKDIIVNLNEFARKDSVETEPMDFNSSVESTLKILHNELKCGVNVSLALGDLPPVICQPGLIKQVMLNLIKNGSQAMAGKGDLSLSTQVEDGYAVLRVRDTGPGIASDVIDKIFDPFYTTKPVGEGTGLGLSLCHGIVQRHNGVLEVSETSESGTEFRLALPVQGTEGEACRDAA
ncbi:MAG: sensor histidine kinase [Granulosicoccaceae bacterium]